MAEDTVLTVVGPGPEKEPPDRLTVRDHIYHLPFEGRSFSVEHPFERALGTHEQVYERSQRATLEWKPLDLGWVEHVGMVFIRNDAGLNLQRKPSTAEKSAIALQVLELRFDDSKGVWLIPPGESMHGTPDNARRLEVRGHVAGSKYTIAVIPG